MVKILKELLKPKMVVGLLAVIGTIVVLNCYLKSQEGFEGAKELLLDPFIIKKANKDSIFGILQ